MSNVVRFYHISDVHLEFHKATDPISVVTPHDSLDSVLILNGDIGTIATEDRREQYGKFLSLCSKCFKHIICTRGNHESFGGDFLKTVDKLREMCSIYDNVTFLENEDVMIDDVKVFGAPFFTDFTDGVESLGALACHSMYNDFKKVHLNGHMLHPKDYVQAYRRSVMDCKKSNPDIVVSHYVPSMSVLERRIDALSTGMGSEPLECMYNAGLEDIKYWVYGHDHSKKDGLNSNTTMLGTTECRSHCRGYYRNEHYDEVVRIEAYFDFVKDWEAEDE